MASQPKIIRLSQSSPPPDLDPEEEPPEKKPEVTLIGGIMEKGFSSSSRSDKLSAPQPRVTPFPVARHRSEGPYWAPLSRMPVQSRMEENREDEMATALADYAEPLSRNKDRTSPVASQWRSNRKAHRSEISQNKSSPSDALSSDSAACPIEPDRESSESISSERPFTQTELALKMDSTEPLEPAVFDSGASSEKVKTITSMGSHTDHEEFNGQSPGGAICREFVDLPCSQSEGQPVSTSSGSSEQSDFVNESSDQSVLRKMQEIVMGQKSQLVSGSGPGGSNMGMLDAVSKEIDAENRKALFSMSSAEVAEAQAELSEKLRPELVELLRKRGLEKERRRVSELKGSAASRSQEGRNPDGNIASVGQSRGPSESHSDAEILSPSVDGMRDIPTNQTSVLQGESANGGDLLSESVTAGDNRNNAESPESNTEKKTTSSDLWTLRVEAVRTMRFNIDGEVVFFEPAKEEPETAASSPSAAAVNKQQDVLSAVERDMIRTEGDPAGSGYTLKEALGLVRSTVPGQRSVALRLISAVLEKATVGFQNQQRIPTSFADLKGLVDWQAVWAYALGPEAELVLTLRLALDDGHSTVVATCARAIQALFSYASNESYFDCLEGLWPGDDLIYTAPIFRLKTKHNEGFIGSGRWKYNVKRSEMFPFSGNSVQEQVEEEGKDTVGEDGHVANKDVVAGLVRMGLLPRIRYILEVEELIVPDDALLCVLIAVARHSPAGAAAVMNCPRLIDTILSRFLLQSREVPEASLSCQLKAVRLLKALSQASRFNCMFFEKCGVLEALLRPFLQQPSRESLGIQDNMRGFRSNAIEILRFWRVCLSYRIGLSFFTDCYPTLCIWLLPLSEDEILCPLNCPVLAMESYSLLEKIARTLPILHDNLSPTDALAVQLGGTKWSWSVAMTMVNTALKWLSPDRISAVLSVAKQYMQAKRERLSEEINLASRTKEYLGLLGSVLHFLATVCEKIVSEKDLECSLNNTSSCSLPWLPTFVPHLGLALATCGLLDTVRAGGYSKHSNGGTEKPHTLFDHVFFGLSEGGSILAALNCQLALVRVSSMVDKLISVNKLKGVPISTDQLASHATLDQGLVVSAEGELRRWVSLTGKVMTSRNNTAEMSVRGGPAPGVGVGWGSLLGGIWSRSYILAQASARLNLELISVLSVKGTSTFSDDELLGRGVAPRAENDGPVFGPLWRINAGLAVAALTTPPNADLLGTGCSLTIFHPDSLSLLLENIKLFLRSRNGGEPEGIQGGNDLEHPSLHPQQMSKILIKHLQTFWLAPKKKKISDGGEHRAIPGKSNGAFKSKLSTVHEGSSEGDDTTPESLMQEFAGQRLPLPSHWFLSPLVTDTTRATTTDTGASVGELEDVITAGLALFLGLEFWISATGRAIPLVRKIHSLSCVFVTGGDVFLQPPARDIIGVLQDIIGRQVEESLRTVPESNGGDRCTSNGEDQGQLQAHRNQSSERITPDHKERKLDFEGSIDPSYMTYAETLAEQFVASSYGDLVFGRQVALHLSTAAPDIIRLATWRVLFDARVLELLPPLSKCCGQLSIYLSPTETDLKMIEAFLSAWASGALDKAASRNSLPFRLALHYLGGYIFDKRDVADDLLTQKKLARTLVRSTLRRSDRQAMLIRLLSGATANDHAGNAKEQVKTRLAFLTEACEGDALLLAEIQRVTSIL
ncbi:RNA polymerase II-associated protein 1 [Marchantia polymorpha subsp. ruderalis]